MLKFLLTAVLFATVAVSTIFAADKDSRYYELRVYSPNEGKQANVVALIKQSGMKFMAKHNIEVLGAWTPVDEKDDRVITFVVHKDKETADKNWAAFQADADWKKELDNDMANKGSVKSIARIFLNATDYSPMVKAENVGGRVFELRTYVATPNNLVHLNARFREVTLKLFAKYGMTNIGYYNMLEGDKLTNGELLKACSAKGKDTSAAKAEDAAAPTALVYFLTHKDSDAMKKSFGDFVKDPEWDAARKASEVKGGGSLTVKDGVKSLLLKPTDFSPIK